jgi:acetyl esterase/lipase
VYKEVDNIKITTDIYLPPKKEGKHPVSKLSPVALLAQRLLGLQDKVIDIHGGGFCVGNSLMVSKDQINDCLERGWIVVVPNHRLSPQVNLLEGPMRDCRDLLAWVYDGSLQAVLDEKLQFDAPYGDLDKVMAFGTSAGGHLSLAMCWDVPKPPRAILDFYGPCGFAEKYLNVPEPGLKAHVPEFDKAFINKVYDEDPIPTTSVVNLEGHGPGRSGPVTRLADFSNPRDAFTFHHLANGTMMQQLFPSQALKQVDPLLNVSSDWPPVCIVHGQADKMVPIELSRMLFEELKRKGVQAELIEIPGAQHTFAGSMVKGDEVWNMQRNGFDFLERVISS